MGQKQLEMNSNATSKDGAAASQCSIGILVDKTATGAYVVSFVFIIAPVIVCCPLTVVLNLLVIFSVKTKPRRLQTVSNIVLGCLAVTDVLLGAIGMPLFILLGMTSVQAVDSTLFAL